VQQLRRTYPEELGELEAVIICAKGTPAFKLERMLSYEGVRIEYDEAQPLSLDEARQRAEAMGREAGTFYMTHSGPDSVASFGSLGLEILEDLLARWQGQGLLPADFDVQAYFDLKAGEDKLDDTARATLAAMEQQLRALDGVAVIVPVGAGGIASGVVLALKLLNPHLVVLGVASDRTDSMSPALRTGWPVTIPTPQRVLDDGVKTSLVEAFALTVFQRAADGMITVPYEQIPAAMQELAFESILAEGAAALPQLALRDVELRRRLQARGIHTIVTVVTGQNIDMEEWADLSAAGRLPEEPREVAPGTEGSPAARAFQVSVWMWRVLGLACAWIIAQRDLRRIGRQRGIGRWGRAHPQRAAQNLEHRDDVDAETGSELMHELELEAGDGAISAQVLRNVLALGPRLLPATAPARRESMATLRVVGVMLALVAARQLGAIAHPMRVALGRALPSASQAQAFGLPVWAVLLGIGAALLATAWAIHTRRARSPRPQDSRSRLPGIEQALRDLQRVSAST
jgi:threonine dehydratase